MWPLFSKLRGRGTRGKNREKDERQRREKEERKRVKRRREEKRGTKSKKKGRRKIGHAYLLVCKGGGMGWEIKMYFDCKQLVS